MKKYYVIRYRLSKSFFIKLGVKETKISLIIPFNQEPLIKPYIETNNEKGKELT